LLVDIERALFGVGMVVEAVPSPVYRSRLIPRIAILLEKREFYASSIRYIQNLNTSHTCEWALLSNLTLVVVCCDIFIAVAEAGKQGPPRAKIWT
jgi:hypothetical protein